MNSRVVRSSHSPIRPELCRRQTKTACKIPQLSNEPSRDRSQTSLTQADLPVTLFDYFTGRPGTRPNSHPHDLRAARQEALATAESLKTKDDRTRHH